MLWVCFKFAELIKKKLIFFTTYNVKRDATSRDVTYISHLIQVSNYFQNLFILIYGIKEKVEIIYGDFIFENYIGMHVN